jgi:teichuronic acid biosynthesis glycosyltransferase TuaC
MARCRVCVVTSLVRRDCPPALVSFVAEQIAALTAAGCDVTVVTPYDQSGRWRGRRWCLRQLRDAAQSGRFDVFHVHYGSILGCGAVVALRGYPTVLTLHGSDVLGMTYASIRKPAEAFHLTMGVVLTQIAVSLADATIAVSSRVRDGLPRWIRRRTTVVPCGVDFDRFSPGSRLDARRRLGVADAQFLVLFASPRRGEKNVALASTAVARASAVDSRIALLMADDVRFEAMPDYVRAADVLLLTSHSEGSPVITKEALACNTPIVTVNVGDVTEQLAGVRGCAVVPRDAEAIARTLVELARQDVACNGRERSVRYDNRTIAGELMSIYAALGARTPTAERKPSLQEAR